jgi:hypothetical protein
MRCSAGCLKTFRRLSVLVVLLATPLIFVWVGMSQQQDVATTPLEKLVPSRTIALLSAPNLAQLKADFKNTSMNKIWNDEEVKFTVDMVMKSVQKPLDDFKAEFEKETGTKFDSALELLDGQISVALVDVGGMNKEMPFSVALAVDVKNKRDVAEKLIGTFEKSLVEGSGEQRSPFETLKIRDMDFRRFEPQDGVEIYFGFLGGTFVVTTNKETLTLMVTNFKEPTPDQLANNPLFQQLKNKVGGDKLAAFLYVTDAESVIAKFEDEIDPDIARVIENLGLKTIGGLAAGITLGDEGPGLCAYLHAPGERKGITKIASMFKPSQRSMDCVPQNAVAYAAVRVNLGEVYDEVMKIAEGVASQADWADFKQGLAEYEKKVGCSIKADLLDSIGEDVVTYSAYPEGGSLMPYTVYVLDLKNTDKAVTSIEKMITGSEILQIKSIPCKNAEIKYVSVKARENEGRGGVGEREMIAMSAAGLGLFGSFPMSYCVLKDKLYLSTFAQGLKDMLRGIEEAKPVAGVPVPPHKIAVELKGVPADAVAVSYTDVKAIFAPIYNTILQVLCMIEPMFKANVSLPFELDMAAMPSAHAIAQYLAPTVGWWTSDKDGFTIKSGSESGLLLGVAGVAMVAAIAIPSLSMSRVAANETSAAGTLKNFVTCEATWRQNDTDRNANNDYWTGDVSGFCRVLDGAGNSVKMMDIAVAKADWAPLPADADGTAPDIGPAVADQPVPKSGYYFMAMRIDENGEPYQNDGADADANAWENTGDFAFVAFPAEYGKTGINTFIVNGDGVIWKKDLGPILDKKVAPVAPEAPLTPEAEKRVDELIKQLAADDFNTREAAEAELEALGKPAAAKLEKAAESDDPETRMRAKKLLRKIGQGGIDLEAIQTWPGVDPSMEGWMMAW